MTILDFYPRPPGGGRQRRSRRRPKKSGISIHALRVEGDLCEACHNKMHPISIHALRVEGDRLKYKTSARCIDFYPRPPGGGRLAQSTQIVRGTTFLSTPSGWRATRKDVAVFERSRNFYPRPPGGGRPQQEAQFTRQHNISIHALRVEGDNVFCATTKRRKNFYPRPPGGGRRIINLIFMRPPQFLSTPSGWRATRAQRHRQNDH